MKTLLVVSGGDAPGINAVLYHYTQLAEAKGDQVVGVMGSFAGLLQGERARDLSRHDLESVRTLGGSYLTSSRAPVLRDENNRTQLVKTLIDQKIDNVVLLGGDGSLRHIPPILRELGIACISLPTTIDNDVPGTDQTIGFDTACNFAHHSIDAILATARALPGRVFSVETLGGNTGMLALDIAYAAGAHAVLVPEYSYDLPAMSKRIVDKCLPRAGYALLVFSEGIIHARTFNEDFQQLTGHKVRDTRLGHAQRAVAPSHQDRLLAKRMAQAAYEALRGEMRWGMVVSNGGHISIYQGDLQKLPPRLPDRQLYDQINEMNDE